MRTIEAIYQPMFDEIEATADHEEREWMKEQLVLTTLVSIATGAPDPAAIAACVLNWLVPTEEHTP